MQEIQYLDFFSCWQFCLLLSILDVRFFCISTCVSLLVVVRVVLMYLAVDTEMCRMCFHGYLLQLDGAIQAFICISFFFFFFYVSCQTLNRIVLEKHQTTRLSLFKQVSSSSLNVMEEDLLTEYQEGTSSYSTSDNQKKLLSYCPSYFYPFFVSVSFPFCQFLHHLQSGEAQCELFPPREDSVDCNHGWAESSDNRKLKMCCRCCVI